MRYYLNKFVVGKDFLNKTHKKYPYGNFLGNWIFQNQELIIDKMVGNFAM